MTFGSVPAGEADPESRDTGHGPGSVGAVVLAAGSSRRMGVANKLLEPLGGVPMIVRVVDRLLASRARPLVVVTGHDAERVEKTLGHRDVRIARNPDFEAGMSTSLRRGLEALEEEADASLRGVVVCLGDMPEVASGTVDALVAAFLASSGHVACVPVHRGRRGNPVLWGVGFIAEMKAVQGDTGARGLLADHPEVVLEVPVDDPGVLLDVDTRDALTRLRD